MSEKLTLQTEAAFERIYDSLLGKTDDDFDILCLNLDKMSKKANEIRQVTMDIMTGET